MRRCQVLQACRTLQTRDLPEAAKVTGVILFIDKFADICFHCNK